MTDETKSTLRNDRTPLSLYWTATAPGNPYDWGSRRQFPDEARGVLQKVYDRVDQGNLRFPLDDTTREKAVWMLHQDALETLRDCVDLLEQGKHRLVGKMFRDVVETLDLAAYFAEDKAARDLQRWYQDEIIPHAKSRKSMFSDQTEAKERADFYGHLSRWTHHNYRTLANAFSLGKDDLLVCDSHAPDILVLPQTVTEYMWMLAQLIRFLTEETTRLDNMYGVLKDS